MNEDLDKIRAIKQQYEQSWLSIRDVVAIGIGRTSDGSIGLIVSVKKNVKKIRSKIPPKIEDVLIDIQETGEIKAL